MNFMHFIISGLTQAGRQLPPSMMSPLLGTVSTEFNPLEQDGTKTQSGDPTTGRFEPGPTTATGSREDFLAPYASFSPTSESGMDTEPEVTRAEEEELLTENELAADFYKVTPGEISRWYDQANVLNLDSGEVLIPQKWEERQVTMGQMDRGGFDPSDTRLYNAAGGQQIGPDGEVLPIDRPGFSRAEVVEAYHSDNGIRAKRLNQLLRNSGYAPDREPIGGISSIMDSDFQSGWRNAARDAAAAGMPIINYLEGLQAQYADWKARQSGSGSGSGRIRPPVQLISKDDAKELLEETSKRLMGRTLTEEEQAIINDMTEAIRGTQRSEQNALIDRRMAGGGEADDPTSVQTLAEDQVEEGFDTEVTGYRIASAFTDLTRMIGG